jgi:hypothetical protein
MMMQAVPVHETNGYENFRRSDRVREKFQEVFGRECTLRDDLLLKRYSLTHDGDLVMFIR